MAKPIATMTAWPELKATGVYLPKPSDDASAPELDEQNVVNLVVADFNRSVQFIDEHEWYAQWRDNDILYQSPVIQDPRDPTKARVSRFSVNNDSNTMGDAVKSGMFAQNPPFFLRQRGKTSEEQLKAWTALLGVLCDRMKLSYWAGLGIQSQVLQGTGIMKAGWSTRWRTVLERRQEDQPEQVGTAQGGTETVHTEASDKHKLKPKKIKESYPWVEYRQLGTTVFDPGWRTPNAPEYAGYAIDIDYVNWRDLEGMSKEDYYTVPDLTVLKDWFFARGKRDAESGAAVETGMSQSGSPVMHAADRSQSTSADIFAQPILMLTRTDADRSMVVLKIDSAWVVVQNREHGQGRIPHFTFNWRNVDNAGYGMGLGRLVGGDQRVEQGVLNHALNLLAYQFNPAILYALGSGNAPTGDRTIRAGGFIGVNPVGDDVRKAWAVAEMPQVPGEAWQMIQYSQQSGQATSGADATFMGGNLGQSGSSAARTATGAGRIAQKSDARVQTPVENVETGFIVPFIHLLIDWVRMYMPLNEIREIVSGKLGDVLAARICTSTFFEAELEAEVLAGAKLAAKAAMAQQLPYLMQVFQQPQLLEQLHMEGKTVRLQVILDVLFAVSEYRMEDEIIDDLTPAEKQHYQATQEAQSGGGAKNQVEIQKEQLRGQNAQLLEHQRGQNALMKTVIEKELERAGGGNPLIRAGGLVDRSADEKVLQGAGPSPLAGV